MKKKAVIFDMDGVLIDSEPVYLQLFRDLLRENGCVIDEEKMRVLAGASGSRLWGTVAQMWKEKVPKKCAGSIKSGMRISVFHTETLPVRESGRFLTG